MREVRKNIQFTTALFLSLSAVSFSVFADDGPRHSPDKFKDFSEYIEIGKDRNNDENIRSLNRFASDLGEGVAVGSAALDQSHPLLIRNEILKKHYGLSDEGISALPNLTERYKVTVDASCFEAGKYNDSIDHLSEAKMFQKQIEEAWDYLARYDAMIIAKGLQENKTFDYKISDVEICSQDKVVDELSLVTRATKMLDIVSEEAEDLLKPHISFQAPGTLRIGIEVENNDSKNWRPDFDVQEKYTPVSSAVLQAEWDRGAHLPPTMPSRLAWILKNPTSTAFGANEREKMMSGIESLAGRIAGQFNKSTTVGGEQTVDNVPYLNKVQVPLSGESLSTTFDKLNGDEKSAVVEEWLKNLNDKTLRSRHLESVGALIHQKKEAEIQQRIADRDIIINNATTAGVNVIDQEIVVGGVSVNTSSYDELPITALVDVDVLRNAKNPLSDNGQAVDVNLRQDSENVPLGSIRPFTFVNNENGEVMGVQVPSGVYVNSSTFVFGELSMNFNAQVSGVEEGFAAQALYKAMMDKTPSVFGRSVSGDVSTGEVSDEN